MNTLPLKKWQALKTRMSIWLVLMMCLSSCVGSTGTPESGSFEYQVRVQAGDTGTDLSSAEVRIEFASKATINDVTDVYGTARIFIDSSSEGKPARLIVEKAGYQRYVKNIDLRKDLLPTIIQLIPTSGQVAPSMTNTTSALQTVAPALTDTPLASSTPCVWIPYLANAPTPELSQDDCFKDLRSFGISGDSQKISFFVGGRSSGVYGVCRDISERDNLEIFLVVSDNIVATRFLATIGPDPVPNKSTHVFRIQPQIVQKQAKEIYLKFLEYTPAGFDKEIDEMKAPTYWQSNGDWRFDFVLQFNGAKASASVNQMSSPYVWSSDPLKRYLCFVYEATPTVTQAAELEVHVNIP